jgi:hypothetical protein
VTITKAITISSECSEAGVLVSGTNGIVVNVPNATDFVVLRGLDIEGLATGLDAIKVLTGGSVQVEKCTINRFSGFGINFVTTVANTKLSVSDTFVRNNGSGVNGGGIVIQPSAAANAAVSNVRMMNNVFGFKTTGPTKVTVVNSVSWANSFAGFAATGASGPVLNIERSVSSQNGTGIVCDAGTTVRLGNNSITDNGAAVS